jgi:hypothetical protein
VSTVSVRRSSHGRATKAYGLLVSAPSARRDTNTQGTRVRRPHDADDSADACIILPQRSNLTMVYGMQRLQNDVLSSSYV